MEVVTLDLKKFNLTEDLAQDSRDNTLMMIYDGLIFPFEVGSSLSVS